MGDTFSMTSSVKTGMLVGGLLLAAPAPAEMPREADRDALRQGWHACLREAFSGQPAALDKKKAQRAALAQCKPSENALVAAELAAQEAEEARRKGGLTTRARAWMSSVAGYVVDPVLSWIGR